MHRLPLVPASPIALVCPSGPPDLELTRAGMTLLQEWGYRPQPGPLLRTYLEQGAPSRPQPFLAGSDEQRLADLRWGLSQGAPCWVVRGGHGLLRLLPSLREFTQPCPVLGFSDVTALLWSLQTQGWPDLVHAPNVQTLPKTSPGALAALREGLQTGIQPAVAGVTWVSGVAEGELCGGNLCVLAALCGSGYPLECRGKVLFLEDVNEAGYRLDRLLVQLHNSGALEGLAGLVFGRFEGCAQAEPVLRSWADRLAVPTLAEVACGHWAQNLPLLLGRRVRLAQGTMVGTPRSTSSAGGAASL